MKSPAGGDAGGDAPFRQGFSRWVAKPDPERERHYLIEVSEARDYPEQLCWTTDGFINEMARQHKTPDLWSWTRPTADAIRFRTTRAV